MQAAALFQHLTRLPDLEAVSRHAAERWCAVSREAITERCAFHVALSGGSTPECLYRLLAESPYRERNDWTQTHIYFGDERGVPHDHPESNYRMAREALLDHVPIPPAQIHPIAADPHQIERNAEAYHRLLAERLPGDDGAIPRLDLLLLGMGPDGHTASLFPGTALLEERKRLAGAVYLEQFNSWRISITLPLINRARHTLLLVCGSNKTEALRHAASDGEPRLPIQYLEPEGELEWCLDQAAAAGLEGLL